MTTLTTWALTTRSLSKVVVRAVGTTCIVKFSVFQLRILELEYPVPRHNALNIRF